MSYQGRSPMKDVLRSVVMGAGMISPALLDACATNNPPTTAPVGPASEAPVATTPPVATVPPAASSAVLATPPATTTAPVPTPPPVVTAPPTTVVRPRTSPTGSSMPTRGFSGAARARA